MASWTGEARVMRGLPTTCRVGVVLLTYVTFDQSTVTVVSANEIGTTVSRRATQQRRTDCIVEVEDDTRCSEWASEDHAAQERKSVQWTICCYGKSAVIRVMRVKAAAMMRRQ